MIDMILLRGNSGAGHSITSSPPRCLLLPYGDEEVLDETTDAVMGS